MFKKIKYLLKQYLKSSEEICKKQIERASELEKYNGMTLKLTTSKGGNRFYCARRKGETKFTYLGGEDDPEVRKIKEAHYLQKSISAIQKNNKLIKALLSGYTDESFEGINDLLPELYKNYQAVALEYGNEKAKKWKEQAEAYKSRFEVLFPEGLIISTYDGNYVRSRSEGMIYNLLLSLGITFVYELPLKTKQRVYYPDFTILSEIDYETEIILEHFGMMSKESYRKRSFDKIMDYMRDGYIAGINIFYTYEYLDGGVNLSPVSDIINLKIRPDKTDP